MAEAPVRKTNQTASAVRRGSSSSGGGAYGVGGRGAGPSEPDDVWVEVEPVADIAAKGHAYISFDPA